MSMPPSSFSCPPSSYASSSGRKRRLLLSALSFRQSLSVAPGGGGGGGGGGRGIEAASAAATAATATTHKAAARKRRDAPLLLSTFPLLLALLLLPTFLPPSTISVLAFHNAPLATPGLPARHRSILPSRANTVAPSVPRPRPRLQRGPAPLQFSPAFLNVGTPEVVLILLVGYFVLGPQDLYRVAKETGQLVNNVQTAGTDAWKVFQEAMEAEGTMAAMGASVNEINNVRQNFFSKFLDVRAERTLDQLEEKGMDVEALTEGMGEEDEWGSRLKEHHQQQ
ncbi:Hypothetical protein NocV09_02900900 [Nannochloropsis oceanica]